MIEVARGLHVIPHVEPAARLTSARASPAIRPPPPYTRNRTVFRLMLECIRHVASRRKGLAILACASLALATCGPDGAGDARDNAGATARAQPPRWPTLPRTSAEAEALIRERALRDPGPERPEPTAAEVLSWLPREGTRGLVAGLEPVLADLTERLAAANRGGRDAYLLVGTHHDSAGQVDLFRRLVGPGGIGGLTDIVVEQLVAGGRWQGVDAADQRGDDAELESYLSTGAPDAWRALERAQRHRDYAAWRYGYVPVVMDLVAAARAGGVPLRGCDMPSAAQRLARGAGPRGLDRLRELHCALALRDAAATGPRRVAMLWGQEHAQPAGFARFVPERDAVIFVRVIGHRANPLHLEGQLAPSLVVNEPTLVEIPGAERLELALLLPDQALGGDVERSRVVEGGGRAELAGEVELEIDADERATFAIGDRSIVVGEEPVQLAVPRTSETYLLRTPAIELIGRLELAPATRVELSFSPEARSTRAVYTIAAGDS